MTPQCRPHPKVVRILAALSMLSACDLASAGTVATDGTVGPARALPGPSFAVGADLGRQVGPNLFHSFRQFDLSRGEVATFAGPPSVRNVFARVTGGTPSTIDGTLRSEMPNADFYLANPAGVVFGPNAILDVRGSFAVTTADVIRLADGGRFDARAPGNSVLTSAPPAAFGFLGPQRPADLRSAGARLAVAPGRAVTLSGGDVVLDGTRVAAPGGRVDLVSAPTGGDWPIGPAAAAGEPAPGTQGVVSLVGASVAANGPAGGRVVIRARDVTLDRSSVTADVQDVPPGDLGRVVAPAPAAIPGGPGVDVRVGGTARLAGGSTVSASTPGAADAGNIVIAAGQLLVSGGSQVQSNTAGAGRGGGVRVQADLVRLDGRGPADPGPVDATARNSGLSTAAAPGSTGRGGDIEVTARRLEVVGGGKVTAATFAAGDGGAVTVAADQIRLDGIGATEQTETTGIYSGVYSRLPGQPAFSAGIPTGRGGRIQVDATGLMEVLNGAQIDVSTDGVGDAGSLTLRAGRLRMDGTGTRFVTGIDTSTDFSTSLLPVAGNAGSVRLDIADALEMSNGALINAATFGPGRGQGVDIRAGRIRLDGGGVALLTGIFTSTIGPRGGAGGDIRIDTPDLHVVNGAVLTSSTLSPAPGGQVDVTAGRLVIDRGTADFRASLRPALARLFGAPPEAVPAATAAFGLDLPAIEAAINDGGEIGAQTFFSGDAGRVAIEAGSLTVAGGARVSALSSGTGRAGGVDVTAGSVRVRSGGGIAVSANGATGGSLTVDSRGPLLVRGGQISAESQGAGGNISLSAGDGIIVADSEITARAGLTGARIVFGRTVVVLDRSTVDGRSGDTRRVVSIRSDDLLLSDSRILTSTPQAFPEIDIAGTLVPLRSRVLGGTVTLIPACTTRVGSDESTFILTGRGGEPPQPGGWAADELIDWRLELAPQGDR